MDAAQLLQEKWNLEQQLDTSLTLLANFKAKCEFLEENASYTSEKIRLEDVLVHLLHALASARQQDREAARLVDKLVDQSSRLLQDSLDLVEDTKCMRDYVNSLLDDDDEDQSMGN